MEACQDRRIPRINNSIFVIPFPGIKLGVGVDLVWAFDGSGYIGATISLTAGVDVVDVPFLDVAYS